MVQIMEKLKKLKLQLEKFVNILKNIKKNIKKFLIEEFIY